METLRIMVLYAAVISVVIGFGAIIGGALYQPYSIALPVEANPVRDTLSKYYDDDNSVICYQIGQSDPYCLVVQPEAVECAYDE